MCVALLMGPCVLEVGCQIARSAGYQVITEPTYNSHATPRGGRVDDPATHREKVRFRAYHPIKPHAPLLESKPAKSIPFQP